jgi:hypothetical protein
MGILQDVHSRKTSIPVAAAVGTTEIVAAQSDAWIYIHELIGDLAGAGNLTVLCGSDVVAAFVLDAGQGITEQDDPGNDNVPKFQCKPGDAFSLTVTGGTFNGSCTYSYRY